MSECSVMLENRLKFPKEVISTHTVLKLSGNCCLKLLVKQICLKLLESEVLPQQPSKGNGAN